MHACNSDGNFYWLDIWVYLVYIFAKTNANVLPLFKYVISISELWNWQPRAFQKIWRPDSQTLSCQSWIYTKHYGIIQKTKVEKIFTSAKHLPLARPGQFLSWKHSYEPAKEEIWFSTSHVSQYPRPLTYSDISHQPPLSSTAAQYFPKLIMWTIKSLLLRNPTKISSLVREIAEFSSWYKDKWI